MANTYHSLHVHCVFSTKDRESWIKGDVEQRLWSYIGGIIRKNHMISRCVGGAPDHIHVLISLPASLAVSKAVQLIKGGSCKWIHDTLSAMTSFRWQNGYGAFSVSTSHVPEVMAYIANQREHHRTRTFQEEYLSFLRRHQIAFDEKYLWS